MSVELVRTSTSDGLRLDGAMLALQSNVKNTSALDAVICLSGVGSNFYGSTLIESLAQKLSEIGIAALCVNTRGHDGVSTASTPGGGRLQGAAYEIVDECRHDIKAWVDLLVQRGYERVGLLGHSLGAIKALYTQAYQPHAAVESVIAISPPCLSNARFREGPESPAFFQSMTVAERLVDEGKPRMLFEADFPFPLVISAATYVDKYGPASRYDFLRFATRIECSLCFVYGELELQGGGIAFAGLPESIANLEWPSSPPAISEIPDANHIYVGCHDLLAQRVTESIQQIA